MNNLLEKRFSPRDFDSNYELYDEQINDLLQAARWAPSSYNEQPWQFIYAKRQNSESFARIYDVILDGNKPWSGESSMLVLGIANKAFSRNGKPNRHAGYDLGQAIMSLTIQATDMGLHVHQMGGFDAARAKDVFGLSDEQDAMVVVAIGKRLGSDLPERNRRETEEVFKEA